MIRKEKCRSKLLQPDIIHISDYFQHTCQLSVLHLCPATPRAGLRHILNTVESVFPLCTGQDRLGYTVVTKKPQISVASHTRLTSWSHCSQ